MSIEAPQTPRQVVETLLLDPDERSRMVRFAQRRYGLPLDAAEDVLQDTALQLLLQQRYVWKPRPYLYAVFRIRCRKHLGSRLADSDLLSDADEIPEASIGILDEDPNQRIALQQGLASISSACRKLLAAHFIEGRSLRETAAQMELAYSGITKAITRCLRSLRSCLA